MRWLSSRLRYSNVMSTIAVFIALGGASYAATQLPKNSVGSKQIKNGQVKHADLGKNSVTSTNVKDGSLTGADISIGTLPKVPSASSADNATHATNADTATNAGHATNADTATNAGHATNADTATNAGNATALGSFTADQLTRGTTGSTVVNYTTSPQTKVALSGVTAPVQGQIQYEIGVYCISSSGSTDTRWELQPQVDGTNNGTYGLFIFPHASVATVGSNLTLVGQASVAAGAHTIGFVASRPTGNGSLDCNIQTTSLFFQFKNDGTRAPTRSSVTTTSGSGADAG
jgi:hypothetical protein